VRSADHLDVRAEACRPSSFRKSIVTTRRSSWSRRPPEAPRNDLTARGCHGGRHGERPWSLRIGSPELHSRRHLLFGLISGCVGRQGGYRNEESPEQQGDWEGAHQTVLLSGGGGCWDEGLAGRRRMLRLPKVVGNCSRIAHHRRPRPIPFDEVSRGGTSTPRATMTPLQSWRRLPTDAEKQAASSITMLTLVHRADARLELAPLTTLEKKTEISPALVPPAKPSFESTLQSSQPSETLETPEPTELELPVTVEIPELSPKSPKYTAPTKPIAGPIADEERDFPL